MTGAIARREAIALLRSPMAWVVVAGVQGIVGFIVLLYLEAYLGLGSESTSGAGPPELTAYLLPRGLGAASIVYLLAAPLLTMGSIADEHRQGAFALLLSSPVAPHAIVVGKFTGVSAVLAATVGLPSLMLAALGLVAPIDGGALVLATLGALLFTGAVAAIGVYASALTTHPTAAAASPIGLLLLLLLLGQWGSGLGGRTGAILTYLSPSTHLDPFLRGLLDTGALAYFVLVTALCLVLATRRIDNERLQR